MIFTYQDLKVWKTISQAKDEDTFAAFCHSQLSGGIGMKIRNEMGLWEDSDLKRHFEYVHNCKHPDDMSDLIIRGVYKKIVRK